MSIFPSQVYIFLPETYHLTLYRLKFYIITESVHQRLNLSLVALSIN